MQFTIYCVIIVYGKGFIEVKNRLRSLQKHNADGEIRKGSEDTAKRLCPAPAKEDLMDNKELQKKVWTNIEKSQKKAAKFKDTVAVSFALISEVDEDLYVAVVDGKLSVEPYHYDDCGCEIEATADVVNKLFAGDLAFDKALKDGLAKVKGGDEAKFKALECLVPSKKTATKTAAKKPAAKKAPAKKTAAKKPAAKPAAKKATAAKTATAATKTATATKTAAATKAATTAAKPAAPVAKPAAAPAAKPAAPAAPVAKPAEKKATDVKPAVKK